MNHHNRLLSIIIPTKNRYLTLFSVVDMILSFDLNDDIEIVIQDNSDDSSEALRYISDKSNYGNLKYFYEPSALSVIENCDKAVLNSSGEYLCFIGDDDGVMPNIVEVTKWMKEKGFKALKSEVPDYFWPGQKSNILSIDTTGVLNYRKWKGNAFKVIQMESALKYTLDRGGLSMKYLPCLYQGIVERTTLNKILAQTNTYFPGPSPDMANAVALTQVIDSFVYVNYPVCISGKSTKSTGGAVVLHRHISRIEDVSHLPSDTADNWDSRIPKYWTGPTIWAESVLKALESFGKEQAIRKLNFTYLYAFLTVFNRQDLATIFQGFEFKRNKKFYFYKFDIFFLRTRVFILNRIGIIIKVKNVEDINAAVSILNKVNG